MKYFTCLYQRKAVTEYETEICLMSDRTLGHIDRQLKPTLPIKAEQLLSQMQLKVFHQYSISLASNYDLLLMDC